MIKELDDEIKKITIANNINNLLALDDYYSENGYWYRLGKLSFFNKLMDEYRYHFLYEIQGLSNQIHFGIACSFLFRDKISLISGRPNVYNHRYSFMLESSIHGIYSYWNRVALVLNTYLKNPFHKHRAYFMPIVKQLNIDFHEIEKNEHYVWLSKVKEKLENLNRNEFAHNNSLLMQDFLPYGYVVQKRLNLAVIPEEILEHNKFIVDDIYKLVELLEYLEMIKK